MSGARLSLALLLAASSLVVQARDYAYSDAHLHYVDFFQETAGMDKLLKAMADNRIEHVMISGIPVAKKWHEDEPKRPRYYAGDDADAYWYSATDVIVAAAVNKLSPSNASTFIPSSPVSIPTTKTPPPTSSVCSTSTQGCGRALVKCSPGTMTLPP